MKTTELRIGNYVYVTTGYGKNKGIPYEIKINSGHDIDSIEDNYHEYNPIPLTEEWLLKFGFSEKNNKYKTVLPAISLNGVFIITDNIETLGFRFLFSEHVLRLNYVHQLQSLYFSLTGEELEIK